MKILVIEDEVKAAAYIRQGLAESGYTVDVAHNGTDGLHAAVTGDHDLVILDVMLPGIDGFAVLSALRTSKQVPVLMLTARGKTDDKVRGFDLGADDYLVKPFQFPELLARVRALLKRGQAGATRAGGAGRGPRDRRGAPSRHPRRPAHRPDGQGVRPAHAVDRSARARSSRAPRSPRWSGTSISTPKATSSRSQSGACEPRSTIRSRKN